MVSVNLIKISINYTLGLKSINCYYSNKVLRTDDKTKPCGI